MRHGRPAGGKSADEGRRRERNNTIGGDMVEHAYVHSGPGSK